MTPVFPSDRAEAEEEDVRPRTGLSVLGLLWVGSAVLGARGLLDAGASPIGIGAAALGAALPLAVARITGSRDTVPLASWGAAAVLLLGGLAAIASTIEPGPHYAGLMRWVRTGDAAVAALVFACGGYI